MFRRSPAPDPLLRSLLVRIGIVLACIVFTCIATPLPAHATLGVLVGEPYGSFGTMLPVGHTALYFDHLCADIPTTLRPCSQGESGAVVARYHRVADLDWLAMPVLPFLYGVEDPRQIPAFVTPQLEDHLRERYRKAHLSAIIPNRINSQDRELPSHKGEWVEAIGSAFNRRIFLYEIDTTPEQDAALLTWSRSRPNTRRYSLRHANCADFAADAINFLYPNSVRRNRLADFGMMTPKQVARSLEAFGRRHPEVHLRVYEIPQLPGTLRRSRPLRGAAEIFLKTKRYLAFILVTQPELALADWIIYDTKGKWTPGRNATPLPAEIWPEPILRDSTRIELSSEFPPASMESARQPSCSTSSSTVSDDSGFLAK
jgi:hypothetical protein